MSTGETVAGISPPLRAAPLRLLGDKRLARLAASGHPAAFEAIFNRYHQELYRYCRAILRDAHEAEDALQATMAAAVRALPQERREISLRPWLYRVAHNQAVSILRRRTLTVDLATAPETAVAGADTDAEARERLRQLVADLDALPERQRAALVMRELSDLSYAEIAAALDASEGAARQTVYEARVALRELESGRDMGCEEARRAISDRDGRILRGRRLRAHLRACEGCRDFRLAIGQRRSDLDALCPPLAAVAATGLIASVVGAGKGGVGAAAGSAAGLGAAGTGASSGAAGATIAASAAVKGASLAAAVVLGAGAAGATGVIDTPWGPERAANDPVDARPSTDRPNTGAAERGLARGGNGESQQSELRSAHTPGAAPDAPAGDADRHVAARGADPDGPAAQASAQASPSQTGPPEQAQGGKPDHANGPGEPPAEAQGSPPAHAGASGGPPPHASGGGSATAEAMRGGGAPASSNASPRAHESKPAPTRDPRTGPPARESAAVPPNKAPDEPQR